MNATVDEWWLWAAFALLFGVVIIGSMLPVRPLVLVFPFWAVVVLGAALVTAVVAAYTARLGWPGEVRKT